MKFHNEWWWILVLAAFLISQTLIFLNWKDASWGTFASIILLVGAMIGYANWHFNRSVQKEVLQLFQANHKKNHTVITGDMLRGLPEPVRRWLNNSGIVGKEKIQTLRLKQKGWMRTKPEQNKWIEASSEQYITIDEPAFIWKVRMNLLPLLPVTGRDKFVNGKGQMKIQLLSLINIVNAADEKIDQGALQRYLAEMGMYPSAALSPYIQWDVMDNTSAKATMTYKGVSGSVVFHFTGLGNLSWCSADRYMGGSKEAKLEKWEAHFIEFRICNGINIPVQSEATWKLNNGDFTWYKLEITDIEYNKPFLY